MSGPKISIYKLKGRQREIALEQIRCDALSARYCRDIANMLKETAEARQKIGPSVKLLEKLQERYGGQQDKIREAQMTEKVLRENLSDLENLFRKYRPRQGRMILSEEALREKKEKAQKLEEIRRDVSQLKKQAERAASSGMQEIERRRGEALELINALQQEDDVPAKTKEELQETIRRYYVQDQHTDEKESAFERTKERIESALRQYRQGSISSVTHQKIFAALDRLGQISDMEYLRSFQSITVNPLLQQAEGQKKSYGEKLQIWQSLSGMAQQEGKEPSYDEIDDACRILEETVCAEREKEYIARCTDEVMKEMGYELIGTKETVKRSGKRFRSELYSFSEGTAVNVTYGADGQISMEVGGIASDDRLPDAAETAVLVDAMEEFCSEFDIFERKMAERGILIGKRIAKLPPSGEHAAFININDYKTEGKAEELDVSRNKRKDNELKALYREGE